ncbi:hypothetical protein B0H17DRAFT_1054061 [Mycena rosella]|uniref:Uncharacterized protein n=1 Tax=Mycena rosella TaxID=1033263 RepID=A0AAD7DPK9_MYCRO|nr:hypothetical protein B0H17DRAFT_1054061 [Mycena rosella]
MGSKRRVSGLGAGGRKGLIGHAQQFMRDHRPRRAGWRSRVDSLVQHSVLGSREASPVRSVRFAEGRGGSAASTPLVGVFGEEVHASLGPMGPGDGAEESGGEGHI